MLDSIKKKLHDYIDNADDAATIALISFVKDEPWKEEYVFDEETSKMLDKRWEDIELGRTKSYTRKESIERLRKHLKNK